MLARPMGGARGGGASRRPCLSPSPWVQHRAGALKSPHKARQSTCLCVDPLGSYLASPRGAPAAWAGAPASLCPRQGDPDGPSAWGASSASGPRMPLTPGLTLVTEVLSLEARPFLLQSLGFRYGF